MCRNKKHEWRVCRIFYLLIIFLLFKNNCFAQNSGTTASTSGAIPIIAADSSTTINKGDSVLLLASPSAGFDYQWALNGNKIAGASAPTYYAKETGTYTVIVTSGSYTATSSGIAVTAKAEVTANNFTIKVDSISCKGSNNGSIHISAAQNLKYVVLLSGTGISNKTYNFNDSLKISNLSAGSYSVCISVDGEKNSQCYQVSLTEPKELSVYTVVNKAFRNVDLQLSGAKIYNITLNGVTHSTSASEISLPLSADVNKLSITTDKPCQGSIEKVINLSDKIIPYPNPFISMLNVNIGDATVQDVQVSVINVLNGRSVYQNHYVNQSGIIQLDLSKLESGLYTLNLVLDNKKLNFKVIKQ